MVSVCRYTIHAPKMGYMQNMPSFHSQMHRCRSSANTWKKDTLQFWQRGTENDALEQGFPHKTNGWNLKMKDSKFGIFSPTRWAPTGYGLITPICMGYNPSYPFIKPLIRVITPFITSRGRLWVSRGQTCGLWNFKMLDLRKRTGPKPTESQNKPLLRLQGWVPGRQFLFLEMFFQISGWRVKVKFVIMPGSWIHSFLFFDSTHKYPLTSISLLSVNF